MKRILLVAALLVTCVLCVAKNCRLERMIARKADIDADGWKYIPRCNRKENTYKETQCKVKDSKKMCKCVDSKGTDETEFSHELTSYKSCVQKRCDRAKIVSELKFKYLQSKGAAIDGWMHLECEDGGKMYKPSQCILTYRGETCWLVNPKTGELLDKIPRPQPPPIPSSLPVPDTPEILHA